MTNAKGVPTVGDMMAASEKMAADVAAQARATADPFAFVAKFFRDMPSDWARMTETRAKLLLLG